MATIKAKDAIDFIVRRSQGRFFSVKFRKRTTGETRDMVARWGVQSRRAPGGERAYDFDDHGLVCVFDIQKDAYRTIPKEALISITINGEEFDIIYPKRKEKSNGV